MATEPHKHCPTCGTPIPMSERFCSPRCEQVVAERQRKVSKTRTIIYILFAVLVIVYLFFILKGRF